MCHVFFKPAALALGSNGRKQEPIKFDGLLAQKGTGCVLSCAQYFQALHTQAMFFPPSRAVLSAILRDE